MNTVIYGPGHEPIALVELPPSAVEYFKQQKYVRVSLGVPRPVTRWVDTVPTASSACENVVEFEADYLYFHSHRVLSLMVRYPRGASALSEIFSAHFGPWHDNESDQKRREWRYIVGRLQGLAPHR